MAAMPRIASAAPEAPARIAAASFVERPGSRPREGAGDDEGVARDPGMHEKSDDARDGPGARGPEAFPQRHEHGCEEDRHHEVEAEAPRLLHESAEEIARQGGDHPDHPEGEPGSEVHADIAPALRVVPDADEPTCIGEE